MDSEHDKSTAVSSITDVMSEDSHRAKRLVVQVIVGSLIAIGLAFTGYLNFMLYSTPLPEDMKIVGVIPMLLIEGSLAVFLVGSFVWFAHGLQALLAKAFGWIMFAIVGLNAIVEFNVLRGNDMGEFLKLYSFWGIPLVVVITIAFWKAVIDADPSIQRMRRRRQIRLAIEQARDESFIKALSGVDATQAVIENGEMQASEVARWLRGGVRKELPPSNGHKPNVPVVFAKDIDADKADLKGKSQ